MQSRSGSADVEPLPDHPITRGVAPVRMTDEWYINITVPGDSPDGAVDRARPSPILVGHAIGCGPRRTVRLARGPYPHIVAASGRRETLMWAIERPDGGRGFGLTGGHFHANWANDSFRRVVLNALVWVTGAEVPPSGCESAGDGRRP